MNGTETWDINISSTNTLYKTFKTDSKKYSNITDVTVTDITNESSVNFVKTNDWAYHVTKDIITELKIMMEILKLAGELDQTIVVQIKNTKFHIL